MPTSRLSGRVLVGPSAIAGAGLICEEQVPAGAMVAAFGGEFIDRATLDALPAERRVRCVQVDDALYLLPAPGDPAFNHSCDPNCALSGQVVVVARRPIDPGEELTIDYATRNGGDHDEFACTCGATRCRGKVTGHDWMLPELQQRYHGEFSPYLARRIEALDAPKASRSAFAY